MQQKNVHTVAGKAKDQMAEIKPLKIKKKHAERRAARAIFPQPGHDHGRCSADAMAHAEAVCAGRGERLTPIRRQVLETLAAHHRPLGAYEIIDTIAEKVKRLAPITIYRALDFLVENGLVHRIESRNAFLACINNHGTSDIVVFLICERCGSVGEAPVNSVAAALTTAARAAGFAPHASIIEISGVCAHCRDAA